MKLPRPATAALIFLLSFVCYLPTLKNDFIWDDEAHITRNRNLRTVDGLIRIWVDPFSLPQYYPVTHTTFWAEYQLWSDRAVGYHVDNLLLHGANAFLLGTLLSALAVPGAWLAAAIFCVHPVQVESVAWISERKNVLSGFFYLAALYVYLHGKVFALESGEGSRNNRSRSGAAFGLFVLALLSKTVTATLPAAILLVMWWKRGRITRRDIIPLLPFFVVGAALGLTTAWMERVHVGAEGANFNQNFIERCLVAGRALWFYLGKLLWPHPLIFNYPRWEISAAVWWQYLFPATFLAALVLLWRTRDRIGRGPLAAVLFFAATLAPAIGFFNVYPHIFSWVADHFQYLASIGPITLGSAVLTHLGSRLFSGKRHLLIQGGVVSIFAVLTFQRGGAYRDFETLWLDTLKQNPMSWLSLENLTHISAERRDLAAQERYARMALAVTPHRAAGFARVGIALARQGKTDEAIDYYRRAIEVDPMFPPSWNDLGQAWFDKGNYEEAERTIKKALQLNPEFFSALNNLGTLYGTLGRDREALDLYRKAVELNPDYHVGHYNLGLTLFILGRPEEALREYALALNMPVSGEPGTPPKVPTVDEARRRRRGIFISGGEGGMIDFSSVHNNIGNALISLGRLEEAVAHLREALLLRPSNADAHYNLGLVLARLDRLEEASDHYRMALKIQPGDVNSFNNLGIVLERLGRPDEALASYREVLRLNPGDRVALNNLGNVLAALGRTREAIDAYRAAVRSDAAFAEAHFNLASLLQATGRLGEARAEFAEALRLRPGFEEARQAIQKLDARLGAAAPAGP